MYNRQLKITLYCSEEHFRWNFGRYLKNKKKNTWPFSAGDCKLAGILKKEQIELWYTPRSFQSPYSLAIANGTYTSTDEQVEIALELYMEARYPQAYLSIGVLTTLGVWIIFGLVAFQDGGISGWSLGPGMGFGGFQLALLIFVPLLSLIFGPMAFNNSVKDLEKDILKYMSLIEKKPRKRRPRTRRARHIT